MDQREFMGPNSGWEKHFLYSYLNIEKSFSTFFYVLVQTEVMADGDWGEATHLSSLAPRRPGDHKLN